MLKHLGLVHQVEAGTKHSRCMRNTAEMACISSALVRAGWKPQATARRASATSPVQFTLRGGDTAGDPGAEASRIAEQSSPSSTPPWRKPQAMAPAFPGTAAAEAAAFASVQGHAPMQRPPHSFVQPKLTFPHATDTLADESATLRAGGAAKRALGSQGYPCSPLGKRPRVRGDAFCTEWLQGTQGERDKVAPSAAELDVP